VIFVFNISVCYWLLLLLFLTIVIVNLIYIYIYSCCCYSLLLLYMSISSSLSGLQVNPIIPHFINANALIHFVIIFSFPNILLFVNVLIIFAYKQHNSFFLSLFIIKNLRVYFLLHFWSHLKCYLVKS